MKKRLLSVITALALCLSLLPATALAGSGSVSYPNNRVVETTCTGKYTAMTSSDSGFGTLFASTDGILFSFKDSASVNSYAVEALRWAVGEGLIFGTGTGMLAPQSNATRAQVATILKQFVESLSK